MAKLVCQLENVYLFQLALVGLSNFEQQNSKRIGLARLVDHWQQKLTTYTCRLQSADRCRHTGRGKERDRQLQ